MPIKPRNPNNVRSATLGAATDDHTVASHSDTTATGAELETLTDGSDADALHTHGAILTEEEAQDIVGAMLAGNTETLITVTYQDIDGTIDFVVDADLSNYTNTLAWISDITGSPLSELQDVTITAIASGEILKWNGSAWINNTLAEAGISAVGHTHTESDVTDLDHTDAAAIHDNVSGEIAAITAKTTPVDADVAVIEDSAATNAKKSLSWANIKATLKTYFDTLYAALVHTHTESEVTDLGAYLENVVEDTTPQLGGDLDAQNNNVTNLGDVTFKTGAQGGTLRTGTSAADKFVLQGYDVDGVTYRDVIELDAGNDVVLQVIGDYLAIEDATDTTKHVEWDIAGATTATKTTLDFNQTADRIITFPDATGIVELEGHTHTESEITDLDHTDDAAIHDNVSGEIAALTEKVTPASADLIIIEDSAATNAKKKVQIGNLPSSGGATDHGALTGLADDDHTQYLNTTRHDAHDHSTALGTASIDDLSDADTTTTTPVEGDVLTFDGTNWVPYDSTGYTAHADIAAFMRGYRQAMGDPAIYDRLYSNFTINQTLQGGLSSATVRGYPDCGFFSQINGLSDWIGITNTQPTPNVPVGLRQHWVGGGSGGSGAAGDYAVTQTEQDSIEPGQGDILLRGYVLMGSTQTASTWYQFGLSDHQHLSSSNNFIGFYTSSGTGTGYEWTALTRSGGTSTTTATGVTATTNTYFLFEVFVDDTNGRVRFFIDGSLVATNTTNITGGELMYICGMSRTGNQATRTYLYLGWTEMIYKKTT